MIEDLQLALNSDEKKRFDELCGVVDRGIKTFFEVGMALAEIRDNRLYRESHETFEDFCRKRWDIGKNYANRCIGAACVVRNLVPMGTKHSSDTLTIPLNERQVRPLTEFEADVQRELWQRAIDYSIETGIGRVTGAIVSNVVAEYLRKQTKDGVDKTKARVSRETMIAPVFKERFQVFLDAVSDELNSGFRHTSRVALLQSLDTIRDLVAKAKG